MFWRAWKRRLEILVIFTPSYRPDHRMCPPWLSQNVGEYGILNSERWFLRLSKKNYATELGASCELMPQPFALSLHLSCNGQHRFHGDLDFAAFFTASSAALLRPPPPHLGRQRENGRNFRDFLIHPRCQGKRKVEHRFFLTTQISSSSSRNKLVRLYWASVRMKSFQVISFKGRLKEWEEKNVIKRQADVSLEPLTFRHAKWNLIGWLMR